jgi:hypothetical protein
MGRTHSVNIKIGSGLTSGALPLIRANSWPTLFKFPTRSTHTRPSHSVFDTPAFAKIQAQHIYLRTTALRFALHSLHLYHRLLFTREMP